MERCFPTHYLLVFAWSVVVLIGMVGWGQAAALAVSHESAMTVGWGLHAVWGISVFLLLGALLEMFGLCDQVGITLLIGLGFALAVWRTLRRPREWWKAMTETPRAVWLSFAVIAPMFAVGISKQTLLNEFDDYPAYFSFCEKLLETGSIDEPFSWRRLASLGGHTLLQSTVLANGSWPNIQAFEVAIGPVIFLALILGFRKGILARSRLGIFLALVAVTTPIIRVNTASHMTGVILFLGLFLTLDLISQAGGSSARYWILAGAVAAGLCSLRAQYVPAAFGALFVFWTLSWRAQKIAWPEARAALALCSAGLFVCLLPWMILSFRSSGTPMFPFIPGNNNALYNPPVSVLTPYERMGNLAKMIAHPALLPLFLCGLVALSWRQSTAAMAVFACAAAASILLAFSIYAPEATTVPRYVQPLMLPAAVAILMTGAASRGGRWKTVALIVVVLLLDLPERAMAVKSQYDACSHMDGLKVPAAFHASTILEHRKAQELAPAGKRILVCSSTPFVFDYRRNPLWIIDLPHAASPWPGLPYHRPPEETKRYLRSLGVEYLIFPNFDTGHELYDRSSWREIADRGIPLFRTQAAFSFDFFYTFDRLAASETALGQEGHFTVIQLKP